MISVRNDSRQGELMPLTPSNSLGLGMHALDLLHVMRSTVRNTALVPVNEHGLNH